MISREVIATGATTDEAIENGCKELGLTLEDVKFEILELPKQKTLGLFGGSPATVRVYVERDPAKEARDYLKSIISAMGLDNIEIEIKYNEEENGAELNLTGEGLGNVIGRHGETLAALQYLVSLSANNTGEDYYRITINIGNYREKHESSIENFARKTAQRALKLNTNLALEAMNPYERRLIHTAVQDIEGVSSWSVGEGASRHVVIGPEGVNEGEDGLPVNKSRSYGRGGYNRGYGQRGYSGRGGYKNRRYSGGRNSRYRGYNGYNNYGYNGGSADVEEQSSGYTRQGRYAGNHNYSTGYDSYDRNGYSRDGYGSDRKQYGEDNGDRNREGGYRRNNYYGGGGYNRGGGRRGYKNNNRNYGENSYSDSGSSNNSYEKREVRKDSSAPLYGRIEVPKKSEEDE